MMINLKKIPGAAMMLMVCAMVAVPAYGQFENTTRTVNKRGTTAAEFLSIPIGARATAMGSAVTASIDDGTSIYWNPAGLAKAQAGFTGEYAQWLAEIDMNYLAVVLPTGAGTFGVGITSLRTPEMEVTTVVDQNGTGETFSAASYALALAFGRDLTDRFAIGGSVKLVNERIWNSTATGVAVDIGTNFVTPFKDIRLGATISNFGTKMHITGDDLLVRVDVDPNNSGNNESNRALLKTDRFDLPLTMRIGLAGEAFESDRSRLTLAIEALNPNNSEQYLNVGAELGLLGDLVMLRGGYSEFLLEDNVRSLTLGAGLRYRFAPLNFAFDYSYEAQEFFTDVSRFTLAVRF